ncbi:hypothetical protein BDV93DRAFT_523810 [Ceratobasidium sp. AG-I]|nr:hypothetical protein BDV93DRAFT_523810 [Ceratobasidium sp. AG-I]
MSCDIPNIDVIALGTRMVFDILRKDKRRMATLSFWYRVLTQCKWFLLQFSVMGGYGIYITLKRDTLPLPSCAPSFFQNKIWTLFIHGISAFPILNACMLFVLTSTIVWLFSVLVAVCSRKGWKGQVDPRVFCVFWLVEFVFVIGALVITIELQMKKNRQGGSVGWPFGSTLAVASTFIPLRLVAVSVWQLTVGDEGGRPISVWGSRASRRTSRRTSRRIVRSASDLEGLNQRAGGSLHHQPSMSNSLVNQPTIQEMNNPRISSIYFGPPPYRAI